jgi:hypothetical protein
MKRLITGAVLLMLLPLTLAPRTSWPLANGWRADVVADGFERARGDVHALALVAIPPASWDAIIIEITVAGGAWELLAASTDCVRVADTVACTLHNTGTDRQQPLRLVAQSVDGTPLSYSLSASLPQ